MMVVKNMQTNNIMKRLEYNSGENARGVKDAETPRTISMLKVFEPITFPKDMPD